MLTARRDRYAPRANGGDARVCTSRLTMMQFAHPTTWSTRPHMSPD